MATSSRILLIFTVLVLVSAHYALAVEECPDDNSLGPKGCPTGDVPVVMLSFPPYVIFEDDGNGENMSLHGIVYNYILDSLEGCCYSKGSRGVNLILQNGGGNGIETEEFNEALMKADIIFPVTEKLETLLTFSGVEYTFHDIVKSHGYVLIGLIDNYNEKARDLVLDALYDSWPIFVLTFLLAGMAGICIWALVCKPFLHAVSEVLIVRMWPCMQERPCLTTFPKTDTRVKNTTRTELLIVWCGQTLP